MVAIAVVMGTLAFIVSRVVDYPLRDPDGFLGPAWVRLPLLVRRRVRRRHRAAHAVALPGASRPVQGRGPAPDPGALDAGPDHARRPRPDLLLRHLRQLPEPEELPGLRARQQDQ